jgi:uncharacterized protein
MKERMSSQIKYLLFFLLVFTGNQARCKDDFPEVSRTIVTDFTNTLQPDQLLSLEHKLVKFNDTTSTQIAVVMLGSTGGYEIAEYSVQLFNKWHIGQSKKNNGVLLLIAKDDRKVWITTGYGIEGVLTDALSKRIVEREIVPRFRAGEYYEGIDAGTDAIMKIVSGEYTADRYMKKGGKKPVIFPFLMFLFIIFVVIMSQFRRVSRYAHTNNLGFWAAWALLNAASSRTRGSWGGFSGGGSWGGGFGGGGFGGFGGGSSGGGGAGGSW